jgi:hypothetical protein
MICKQSIERLTGRYQGSEAALKVPIMPERTARRFARRTFLVAHN